MQQLVHHNVWNLAIGQDKICCIFARCCACRPEWTVHYNSCHIYYPILPLISWVTNYSLILAWHFSYGNVLYVSVPRWHQGFKIVWIFGMDDRAFKDACILENLNMQKSTSKSSKVLYNSTNNRPWKTVVYLLDTNSVWQPTVMWLYCS